MALSENRRQPDAHTHKKKKTSNSSEKQITNLNQCRRTEHTGSRGAVTQEINHILSGKTKTRNEKKKKSCHRLLENINETIFYKHG